MAFKVTWSAIALDDYNVICEYLEKEWSKAVFEKFSIKVNIKIEMISLQPDIGKRSKQNKNIRSTLITPHNRLYYEVYGGTIEILGIFDTRQDPSKNKFQ